MLTDIDKEFDTPEIDENGELIEVIEEDDIFVEEDTGLEEQPDSFYEAEDDIVQEGEEEDEFDNIQEVTVEAKENYDIAKEQLVAIFSDILERGEITAEDNVEIEQLKEQYTQAYNDVKENTENVQKKTLEERLEELKDGMVGATTDEILNILTDDGRKPWLYKNEDNDVLVDMTAIPELTVLVNKLNLIATDGENEGQIQLTPDFINSVINGTGMDSKIEQSANSILNTVKSTYTSKDDFNNLNISDRNLILASDTIATSTKVMEMSPEFIQLYNSNGGNKITTSIELTADQALSTNTSGSKRVGFEVGVVFTDGTQAYINCWIQLTEEALTCTNKRYYYTQTIVNKEIQSISYSRIFIQGLTSGTVQLTKPKVQISDKPTGWTPAPEDVEKHISTVEQLANQIEWIIKSGTSESNMILTDALYSLLTETISLTAKNINLNGYISNDGGNFALDQQGNMEVQDLSVKGEFSCESLTSNTLNNPRYPEALDGSMNVNIDETNGNDDIELEDGATFQTIGGFFNKCPKNLNGRTINVSFKTDITENVSISYFYCGRIRFYCEGHKISGWVRIESIPTLTQMFGGSVEDPYGAIGSVMPYIGLNQGGVSASFVNYGSVNTSLYNMKVYKAANLASGCTESVAVASGNNGYTYVSNVTPINCEYGFRTNSHGRIHSDSSGGKASKYGFISVSGGYITLSNGSHTGGTKDNTYFSSGGQVIPGSGATFVGTAESGSNTSTTVNTTKSVTYTSNSGNTYRTTYSSWRNDGGVIQGNAYGSGNCIGYWFFGSQFLDLKGCSEISKVVLKVKRLKIGSWSSKLSLKLGFHNQTGKQTTPNMPAYFQSTDIGAYSGDYVSITITDQTVLDRIKAGTLKGFALYDSNFASGSYGGCSGTAKVTITYKE